MSQHDFDIANQTAINARTDLNWALKALASNSSGPSQPTITYSNQWWYDSANDYLFIRNEANSAWIFCGRVDQTAGTFTPNLTPANFTEAIGGTENTKAMTSLRTGQYVDSRFDITGPAPVYAARAWARYNGTTSSLLAWKNIGSVVKNGVGDYTFNYATSMEDGSYAWFVFAGQNGVSSVLSQTASNIRVQVSNTSGVALDVNNINVVIFR